MYADCLFCSAPFGANRSLGWLPRGRRIAFDPRRGRLWVVCRHCGQWNLVPLEERWEAVEECERLFRETRLRVATENVALAALGDGTALVRIGTPLRPELAAWRYGDQFGRRRKRALLAGAVSLAATGGVAVVGATGALPAVAAGVGAVLLETGMLGRAARVLAPEHVVCRLHDGRGDVVTIRERHLHEARILVGGRWGARWGLLVRHGGGFHVFAGRDALTVTGLLLAGVNRLGATSDEVATAVRILERHGDARDCFRWAGPRPEHERIRLTRLPIELRLALEMAAHEERERRVIEGELAVYERAWRGAEAIAAIADELCPPAGFETFLARHRPSPRFTGP